MTSRTTEFNTQKDQWLQLHQAGLQTARVRLETLIVDIERNWGWFDRFRCVFPRVGRVFVV
jgi:hypothetical protein